MKKTYNEICPKCGSENTKKNGIRKGTQRYFCKKCKKVFIEETFTAREKKLLLMFQHLINVDFEKGVSIKQIVKNIDINMPLNTEKIHIGQRISADKNICFCYNPRLLICQDGNHMYIYWIDRRTPEEGASRAIKIIDEDKNSRNAIPDNL